ncbi:serine hydrolase [Pseudomonas sp. 137P]|uniref:Serine hydrolase n=1 Tax=Pseudomonas carassii TaxID=3115855 RepID=A0ABU7H6I8_9PSED|nr:serine hydrolase [Pseudomonas sp. 137P]MEE1886735.1 serine hydrolase [Pseudomonas sp. 137P]
MLISTLSNGRFITQSLQAEPCVPWWSFTKTVLAATALTLVRDRRLALDASLPETTYTLRQLLRHEAGLAEYGELPAWSADERMLAPSLDSHKISGT